MQNFLWASIIGSILLTLLLNLIPWLFPKATKKVERQIHEKLEESLQESESGNRPRVQVFFPWKFMLIASIVLTIAMNLVGWFSR